MKFEAAYTRWENLYRQYRLSRAFRLIIWLSGTWLLGILLLVPFIPLWLLLLPLPLAWAISWLFFFNKRYTPLAFNRLLNQRYAWMEYSAQFIPQPEAVGLAQLQRQRVLSALDRHYTETKVWPNLKGPLALLGIALALHLLVSFYPFRQEKEGSQQVSQELLPVSAKGLPGIEKLEIQVRPPAYTGKALYYSPNPSFQAPLYTTVKWTCQLGGEVSHFYVVFNGKDSLKLSPKGIGLYHWEITLDKPLYYQFAYRQGTLSFISPAYTLYPVDDQAPIINIEVPSPASFVLYGQAPQVQLRLRISDDYGLESAQVVATVTRGSGEAVTFKENKLPLTGLEKGSRQARLSRLIRFEELKMQPGDELFFYVEAADRCLVPRKSRSDTYFVQWEDSTKQEVALMEGISIDNLPAYFRSQRQIIIDTEKLLSQQAELSKDQFNTRSNDLGVDQKVLRLRYGQFLGEEFETSIGGAAHQHSHASEPAVIEERSSYSIKSIKDLWNKQRKNPRPHLHPEESTQEKMLEQLHQHTHNQQEMQVIFGQTGNMLDGYIHKHDVEDVATFFDPAMKAQLKAALGQMWEAELRLRTLRPKEALPFEYKALELIKSLQQKSRIYVERTGFTPPLLKPEEKRLTGELEDIQNPNRNWQAQLHPTLLPALRNAIQVLGNIRSGQPLTSQDKLTLEKAGQEWAGLLLRQPGLRAGMLEDLQSLIKEEKKDGYWISKREAEMLALLPLIQPQPARQKQDAEPELGLFLKQ
jgi:hypothetical protein